MYVLPIACCYWIADGLRKGISKGTSKAISNHLCLGLQSCVCCLLFVVCCLLYET